MYPYAWAKAKPFGTVFNALGDRGSELDRHAHRRKQRESERALFPPADVEPDADLLQHVDDDVLDVEVDHVGVDLADVAVDVAPENEDQVGGRRLIRASITTAQEMAAAARATTTTTAAVTRKTTMPPTVRKIGVDPEARARNSCGPSVPTHPQSQTPFPELPQIISGVMIACSCQSTLRVGVNRGTKRGIADAPDFYNPQYDWASEFR